jgi:hypothetical protein
MTFQSGSFVDDPQNSVWLYSYQIASAAAAPGISGQWPPGFLPIGLQDPISRSSGINSSLADLDQGDRREPLVVMHVKHGEPVDWR